MFVGKGGYFWVYLVISAAIPSRSPVKKIGWPGCRFGGG
jgi:hypothetical protein